MRTPVAMRPRPPVPSKPRSKPQATAGRHPPRKLRLRRPHLGRRTRVGLLLALAVGLGAAYVVGQHVATTRQVELDVVADQGQTEIQLGTVRNPTSPGCGCLDPSFGELPWYGMSLPSQGFDLSVASRTAKKIDPHRWALTAMVPDTDVTDWYATPTHSLQMRVTADHDDSRRTVFDARVSYFVLMTSRSVHVDQPARNPYAALLPAAGGSTTFRSQSGPRAEWGGTVGISSRAPARDSADAIFRTDDSGPELTQRGPMIDLIGPTIHFSVDAADMQLWAGLKRVDGLQRGDSVDIALTTPFSVRLIPHPVQTAWAALIPREWARRVAIARTKDERDQLAKGPTGQGRLVETQPLPPYSIELADLAVPARQTWLGFAGRSAKKDTMDPMLSDDRVLDDGLVTTVYGVPPVSATPEIGVFGPITHYESDTVRGDLVTGSTSTPIARGQKLVLNSSHGVDAGKYRNTPLISSGSPTEQAAISGKAKVKVDGRPLTRPWWLPWLPWVLGAIGAALIAVMVEALVAWARHGEPPSAEPGIAEQLR